MMVSLQYKDLIKQGDIMAPFICKCEGKSYAGWFNKKKCNDCGEVIHNRNGVVKGGYAWKAQRIKDLKTEVKSLKASYDKLRKEYHYMMS